uniref:Uncharacterized protein n=1 Tax=Abalone asfa-like virus TaxID=2839893 RepID=A0A5K7XYP0_9VIRU|nr:hypothetical protein [Abalone asfa-like virus]
MFKINQLHKLVIDYLEQFNKYIKTSLKLLKNYYPNLINFTEETLSVIQDRLNNFSEDIIFNMIDELYVIFQKLLNLHKEIYHTKIIQSIVYVTSQQYITEIQNEKAETEAKAAELINKFQEISEDINYESISVSSFLSKAPRSKFSNRLFCKFIQKNPPHNLEEIKDHIIGVLSDTEDKIAEDQKIRDTKYPPILSMGLSFGRKVVKMGVPRPEKYKLMINLTPQTGENFIYDINRLFDKATGLSMNTLMGLNYKNVTRLNTMIPIPGPIGTMIVPIKYSYGDLCYQTRDHGHTYDEIQFMTNSYRFTAGPKKRLLKYNQIINDAIPIISDHHKKLIDNWENNIPSGVLIDEPITTQTQDFAIKKQLSSKGFADSILFKKFQKILLWLENNTKHPLIEIDSQHKNIEIYLSLLDQQKMVAHKFDKRFSEIALAPSLKIYILTHPFIY